VKSRRPPPLRARGNRYGDPQRVRDMAIGSVAAAAHAYEGVLGECHRRAKRQQGHEDRIPLHASPHCGEGVPSQGMLSAKRTGDAQPSAAETRWLAAGSGIITGGNTAVLPASGARSRRLPIRQADEGLGNWRRSWRQHSSGPGTTEAGRGRAPTELSREPFTCAAQQKRVSNRRSRGRTKAVQIRGQRRPEFQRSA
jgi:hypothetical protein